MNSYYFLHNENISFASIWINGGSNLDKFGKKGTNQILCSLLTKGCKGYDNFHFSELVDSHGADINNEALEDGIIISLKSINDHFEKLFPLLELMVNEPNLLEKDFNNIKKTHLFNLKKSNENPFNKAFENWRKIVYFKHPYAFDCLGYKTDLENISYEDILNEYNNFKFRRKIILLNHQRKYFSDISTIETKRLLKNNKLKNPNFPILNERFIYKYQEGNQVIFMIGNKTCSQSAIDYLPLKLLESYLSFGMSSSLFKLFREQHGITYDVGVFNPDRENLAPFLIYLSTSNNNSFNAFKILLDFWNNITSEKISCKELHLAKVKLKGSLLAQKERTEEIINRKAQLIGFKINPNFDDECLNQIDLISSDKILEISRKYFLKPYLSCIGSSINHKKMEEEWAKRY